ncbi:ribbon-helix-helix protein, CopG family [Massilia sp. YIM B02443]|uniref:ribbon-helix-helix protein, CopG family n=1 Tax=Massilia sp. YIM B02443 TaxID=3050127 RepID=UPI0025B64EB1|nr:ribbon-helix-helix protein, CopG family [Massilia sp. YIM B02443]MDN4037441.1 ribbon-helix-helix protein, CopG family [Massilia sp. YIM B02443]
MATSFNIDSRLDAKLEELKKHFGASSKSEVLRKAIALLDVAARHENADGSLSIVQNKTDETKIILR